MKGIIAKTGARPGAKALDRVVAALMLVVCWIVATLNPSILGMIESLGGPIIAVLLFLMPMYAIRRVPSMRKYSGAMSNVFVVAVGVVALTSVVYGLLS
ncbi:Serine transporter [compost metagenome]